MSGSEQADDARSWHLDKRVNISIIAALFFQACVGVWQVSKMDSRVGSAEEKIATLQRYGEQDRKSVTDLVSDVREIKTIARMLSERATK
jgi:hypothetical protein